MLEKIKKTILITLIILATICILTGCSSEKDKNKSNEKNKSINEISSQIKSINKNTTLYVCEEEKTLYLENRNCEVGKNQEEQNEIMSIIGKNLNTTFKGYQKMILVSYLNSKEKENVQILREVYKLPTVEKEDEAESYILFDEYKDMYNALYEMSELIENY